MFVLYFRKIRGAGLFKVTRNFHEIDRTRNTSDCTEWIKSVYAIRFCENIVILLRLQLVLSY